MAQITLRNYLQETEDAISAGRIDDAFSRCQNVLAQFPESLEVQRLLGEVYLRRERLDDAQQSFDWVLTNDPENVVTYCDRALVSERMSDYDTALDCYQQAYELSRGNSQIRQEFNQLSAKAGQQGFMFSRAGLARMYMRGDLLTQAMQEWEVVLAASPERLDARTGLLETYWREGLYDRVEQLATQILQDVPACLKALLLLAYVTSAKNVQQAQELLQRAEALDPDLQMAQSLFADLMASQPAEPFLKLLRRTPVLLETSAASPCASMPAPITGHDIAPPVMAPSSSNAQSDWSGTEWANSYNWNKNSAHPGDAGAEKLQEQDALPVWGMDTTLGNAMPPNDVWSALDQHNEDRPTREMPDFVSQLGGNAADGNSWSRFGQSGPQQEERSQDLLQALSNPQREPVASNDPRQADRPLWESPAPYDNYAAMGSAGADIREGMKEPSNASDMWASSSQGNEAPAPPSWLNQLTQQGERRQATGSMPALPPVEPRAEASSRLTPLAQNVPLRQPTTPEPVRVEEPRMPSVFAVDQDEEEPFSFGPEWLKSLGAATIDPTFPIESSPAPATPPVAEVAAPRQETYEPVGYEPASQYEAPQQEAYVYEPVPQYEAPQQQEAYEDWTSQMVEPSSTMDQNMLRTLEELEADLRSHGFIPLQPNSLSSIAQNQAPAASEVPGTPEITAPSQEAYQEAYDAYKEPALSSALAELGNFIQQSSSLVSPSAVPDAYSMPSQSTPMPPAPAEEPSWLASLSHSSMFSPAEEPSWLASLDAISTPSAFGAPEPEPPAQEETNPFAVPASPFWPELDALQESLPQTQPEPMPMPMPQEPVFSQPSWIKDEAPSELPEPLLEDTRPLFSVSAWPGASESQELFTAPQPAVPLTRAEPPVEQQRVKPISSPLPPPSRLQETRPVPIVRSSQIDLGSELEATMKRPAIRLQPMQQQPRPVAPKDVSTSARTRGPERTPPARSTEGGLSYQERLLKGYQHQLVGDYDEAMQEYRLIIRNAPELLADVVSNVRALLKLAPKYSAGYRVLGDAYMRQGEYLQAMEAYNKALTMAKRSKG